MVAIKITQEIKDQNELTEAVGFIKTYNKYPNKFWATQRILGGYATRTDLHDKDGWGNVTVPTYNSKTQKLGELIEDGTNFTYEVIDLTDEQIQNDALEQSELDKQEELVKTAEMQIVGQAQSYDDTAALDAQALFPIWSGEGENYQLDFKVQSFLENNELALYRVVQAHTSQANWLPRNTPALFTRVAYPSQILPWVQPTGAQDAYNIGDKVNYEGLNYESTVNANVYAPLVVAGQWIEI